MIAKYTMLIIIELTMKDDSTLYAYNQYRASNYEG